MLNIWLKARLGENFTRGAIVQLCPILDLFIFRSKFRTLLSIGPGLGGSRHSGVPAAALSSPSPRRGRAAEWALLAQRDSSGEQLLFLNIKLIYFTFNDNILILEIFFLHLILIFHFYAFFPLLQLINFIPLTSGKMLQNSLFHFIYFILANPSLDHRFFMWCLFFFLFSIVLRMALCINSLFCCHNELPGQFFKLPFVLFFYRCHWHLHCTNFIFQFFPAE